MTRSRLSAIAIGAALLGAALVFGLGRRALLEPDEGRNAEVAREMAASGDYVVPRLDGLPYPDKPALYFAAVAVSIKALGTTGLAARLPSLLATLLTLALIAWFAARRYGPASAWTAVIVAGTAPLTIAFARTVIFDSTLTLFVTAAVLCLSVSAERTDKNAWVWAALGWGAIGLGILTKGPIALALPLMVIVPWAIWRGRWRTVLDPVGLLLCFAIVSPWVFAMSRAVPGFMHYAIITETVQRLTTPALGRTGPIWYFIPVLLAGALPWSFVLLGAWRRLAALVTARDADAVLFIAWIVTPFVFFSLSQSKRPQYLVPVIPAVGLLVAHLWRSAQDGFTGSRVAAAALGALSITVGLGAGAIARMFGASTAVQAAVPASGWIIAACGIAGAAAALAVRTRHAIVLGLALPTAVLPIAAGPVMDAVARERSSGEIAAAIRPALGETTRIVAAGTFPLSLPYYLGRPVILASADGAELTSNYVLRSPAMRYIDGSPLRPADWWRDAVITCDRPTIVVVRQDDQARRAVLAARLALLIETTRYAVYGPCGKSDMATASRHGPLS